MIDPGDNSYNKSSKEHHKAWIRLTDAIDKCAALSKAVYLTSWPDEAKPWMFDMEDLFQLSDLLRKYAVDSKEACREYEQTERDLRYSARIRKVFSDHKHFHWEIESGTIWKPLYGIKAEFAEDVFAILQFTEERNKGKEAEGQNRSLEVEHATG
ncbi:MAG: hypothetical protein OEZ04_05900 [Nitrospinota bacterium]|nr:hypothetical protein [Nitrospinota bacterium]